MAEMLGAASWWEWLNPVVDIGIVAYIIYRTLLLIRGTRAVRMLFGILLLIVLFFVSKDQSLALPTLNWILDQFIASFIIIVVVVFQDDIRRALSQVGRNPIVRGTWATEEGQFYEEILRAALQMSSHRLGAIVAVERDGDLAPYTEQGVVIDASVRAELLFALFANRQLNPLHDGAVIIRKGRVAYASCFLPLTVNPNVDRQLGTRHRAAIGLSEETDAFVLVVSEETGLISVALGGELMRGYDEESLRHLMKGIFGEDSEHSGWRRLPRLRRGKS